MSKIKLAIIGCGGICRYAHTPALQQLSDYFDVVATCDIIKERAEHFAGVFGAKAYTDDHRQTGDEAEQQIMPE